MPSVTNLELALKLVLNPDARACVGVIDCCEHFCYPTKVSRSVDREEEVNGPLVVTLAEGGV